MNLRFITPIDAVLFRAAVLEEGDPLTQELAAQPWFAQQFLADPALAGAMLGDGRVLGACGLIRRWHGMAEAWLMLSPHAEMPARIAAVRKVKEELDVHQRDPAFRRVEMYCRAAEPWSSKFGRLMGMRQEGLLRQRDPLGRDYRLFARIAGET